jgi:hypothetical protein
MPPMIRSVKTTLFVLGAVFEFAGIMAIGAPDLLPGATRFAAWIGPRLRRIDNRIRRAFHLPRRPVVVELGSAGSVATAGRVTLLKSVKSDATLEEQVAFLLERDQEAQRDVGQLANQIADMEDLVRRRLGELRNEMTNHVAAERAAAEANYRPLRIIGTVALAIGLGLATAGNVV